MTPVPDGSPDFYLRTGDAMTMGGAHLKAIAYQFYRGQFSSVLLETPENIIDEDALIAAFKAQFGQGYQDNPYLNTYSWRGPVTTVYLDCKVITHACTAVLWSNGLHNLEKADEAANARKGAKDFQHANARVSQFYRIASVSAIDPRGRAMLFSSIKSNLLAAAATIALDALTAAAAEIDVDPVADCLYQRFHGQHQACVDRETAKLSAALRSETNSDLKKRLKIIRETAGIMDRAGLDKSPEDEQLEKVERCDEAKFNQHHVECFEREIVKVPPDRRPHSLDILRDTLLHMDQTDCFFFEHTLSLGPAIGLTSDRIKQDFGPPDHVDRTVTASTIREQWVYGCGYLYFENNRMVALHTRF